MPKFVRRGWVLVSVKIIIIIIISIEGQVSYVASMATVLHSLMSSFVPLYLQVSTSMF